MDAEFKRNADFAEFAEAAGIPTSQVIAVARKSDRVFVLIYTPEPIPEDDPDGVDTTAWSCGLGRDRDGILRVVLGGSPTPFSVEEMCKALVLGAVLL